MVSRAAQDGLHSIDAAYVNAGIDGATMQSIPDITEGIDGAI